MIGVKATDGPQNGFDHRLVTVSRIGDLAIRSASVILTDMLDWSFRQIFAVVLAAALGLAVPLQAVQASDMASKMTAAASSDMAKASKCKSCTGDDGVMPSGCVAACMGATAAIVPEPVRASAVERADFALAGVPIDTGHARPPDPYPPRSSLHG